MSMLDSLEISSSGFPDLFILILSILFKTSSPTPGPKILEPGFITLEPPLSIFKIPPIGIAFAEIIDRFIKNIDRQNNKKYDLILFI